MKLRIRNNSVRVRLSRNEVARLGGGEMVEQCTEFAADSRLVSSVESSSVPEPAARFIAGCISLFLPSTVVAAWAESELVSIEGVQKIEGGRELAILVEKDFECLHSLKEGNCDAFPNPRVGPADHVE